jgi:quercetin dioxygenase-like cupin family protein
MGFLEVEVSVVGLVGTLDTKGQEYDFLRRVLSDAGVGSLLIDVGVLGAPTVAADISRAQVAKAAGSSLAEASSQADRGSAISLMARGGTAVALELVAAGQANGRHSHPNCDEILTVLKGKIVHSWNDDEFEMDEGDVISIPSGVIHNARNVTEEPVELAIAFSSAYRTTEDE